MSTSLPPGPPRLPIHPLLGCLPLILAMLLMCLIPLMLYDVGKTAMERLGLSPISASLAIGGIFIGSLFNYPVYEIHKDELQPEVQFGPLGAFVQRSYQRVQARTIVAVNVGGCVIPVALAMLQMMRLAKDGGGAVMVALLVSAISIVVCWRTARPVEGLGILMPGFIPPIVSVLATWLFLFNADPEQRAATAFIAGVAGPVIGADLLNLKKVTTTPVAVMSIGGAGTFDGIVLSGILSALLA